MEGAVKRRLKIVNSFSSIVSSVSFWFTPRVLPEEVNPILVFFYEIDVDFQVSKVVESVLKARFSFDSLGCH